MMRSGTTDTQGKGSLPSSFAYLLWVMVHGCSVGAVHQQMGSPFFLFDSSTRPPRKAFPHRYAGTPGGLASAVSCFPD